MDLHLSLSVLTLGQAAPTLGPFDWLVVGGYFAALIGVVWWSSRKQDTTADYFLAGRNVGFWVIGASLFASNIGSEHIVGLSGSGATTGMAMAHYELHAWIMVLLAWVFVPFYYRTGVYTVPEFLEKRFNAKVRMVLSCVSLAAYVLTKVSVTVYAGAKVFEVLLPNTFGSPEAAFWIGAIATVILTGIYTIFGGLRAVLYTDTAQAVILLVGSAAITAIGLSQLGGWGELQAMAAEHVGDFGLWRPLDDPEFPWLGILIGSPIVGIWYWCTDQYIVQRTLSAKDLRNARRGALFGGILKVTPVLIFIVPGMIGVALHDKGLIELPMKQAEMGGGVDGDRVFATMVTTLLPAGLRGMVVAGMLAALMRSLSSLFNSSASLFTVDIYERIRPGMDEKHLVRVGRMATAAVVVAGLVWIPVMSAVSDLGLYHYLQSVQSYLAPPITTVFLLGLFWKRINGTGALWGLAVGFSLGMLKLVTQILVGTGVISDATMLGQLGAFNWLYFSCVLFGISIVLVIGTSLLSAAPTDEQLSGLTYGSMTEEDRRLTRESWNMIDILLTCGVIGAVGAVYLYFTFWLG